MGRIAADSWREQAADAAPNHSPFFVVDHDALVPGITALGSLAVEFLQGG